MIYVYEGASIVTITTFAMNDQMDDKPTDSTQQVSPVSDLSTNENNPGRKKAFLVVSCLATVCIIAGATFGVLVTVMPNEELSKVQPTLLPQNTEALDKTIQADIEAEQKIDDQLSDEESQAIEDEVNTAETLEGNYAGY